MGNTYFKKVKDLVLFLPWRVSGPQGIVKGKWFRPRDKQPVDLKIYWPGIALPTWAPKSTRYY